MTSPPTGDLNHLHYITTLLFVTRVNDSLSLKHFIVSEPDLEVNYDETTKLYTATLSCVLTPSPHNFHTHIYRIGSWWHGQGAEQIVNRNIAQQRRPVPPDGHYNIDTVVDRKFNNYLFAKDIFYKEY